MLNSEGRLVWESTTNRYVYHVAAGEAFAGKGLTLDPRASPFVARLEKTSRPAEKVSVTRTLAERNTR